MKSSKNIRWVSFNKAESISNNLSKKGFVVPNILSIYTYNAAIVLSMTKEKLPIKDYVFPIEVFVTRKGKRKRYKFRKKNKNNYMKAITIMKRELNYSKNGYLFKVLGC